MQTKLAFLAPLVFVGLSASAGIIYDNGEPAGVNTWFQYSYYRYEDFILSPNANVITDFHWWGAYSGVAMEEDNFYVTIYTFLYEGFPYEWGFFPVFNAHPGHVTRNYTGVIGEDGLGIWEYSLDIPPLVLDAGVTYWLSIINYTTGFDPIWGWSGAASGSHYVEIAYDFGIYEQNDLAFRLTNDLIPEPATMGLLGLGLVALAARFRKNRA